MSDELLTQVGDEVRPMTEEEKTAHSLIVEDIRQTEQLAAEQLESRKAPLRRLGLSGEEINLILGL
jgi:hypothetical protein